MSDADRILDLLEDGTWQEVAKISKEVKLTPESLDIMLRFLSEFNFIDYKEDEKKIRLTQPTRRWLLEIGKNDRQVVHSL